VINPPWFQDPIEQTAFNAYAYHQQSVDDFVKLLAADACPNSLTTQMDLLNWVGLNPEDLTDEDIDYIEREVNRRR
jgi:hypothetical protein